MLKQRVLTALALGAALLLAIFLLPDLLWGAIVSAICVLALREWCALVKIPRAGFIVLALIASAGLMYVAANAPQMGSDTSLLIGLGYALAVFFWLFSASSLLYFGIEPVGIYWRYTVSLIMLMPAGVAMLELRRADPWLLVAAILVVVIADVAAFFTGRRFGRRKLAPAISPGKTWEGVYGACVGVAVFCGALWALVPAIQQFFNIWALLLLSQVFVAICVLGDLFESMLKREAGVKDSGNLLPGHGGVLDRVDAMIAFLPLAGLLYFIPGFLR